MSGWWRGVNPVVGIVLVAAALLVAGAVVPWWWQAHQKRVAEAKLGRAETASAQASGREAVEIVGRAQGREAADGAVTRANEREIRNAEGADRVVDDGVHRAGLDGLCRRAAYRDGERCRLRGAGAE
ncbi:hypothetical protein WJT74_09285 [Sphingomicrobium sp. XHP0239]|uniref:hypothetical protein n=1 Tax=Sphingomicrobium maritimum TaxID=3133972 RepID=UPI0031CC7945